MMENKVDNENSPTYTADTTPTEESPIIDTRITIDHNITTLVDSYFNVYEQALGNDSFNLETSSPSLEDYSASEILEFIYELRDRDLDLVQEVLAGVDLTTQGFDPETAVDIENAVLILENEDGGALKQVTDFFQMAIEVFLSQCYQVTEGEREFFDNLNLTALHYGGSSIYIVESPQ